MTGPAQGRETASAGCFAVGRPSICCVETRPSFAPTGPSVAPSVLPVWHRIVWQAELPRCPVDVRSTSRDEVGGRGGAASPGPVE